MRIGPLYQLSYPSCVSSGVAPPCCQAGASPHRQQSTWSYPSYMGNAFLIGVKQLLFEFEIKELFTPVLFLVPLHCSFFCNEFHWRFCGNICRRLVCSWKAMFQSFTVTKMCGHNLTVIKKHQLTAEVIRKNPGGETPYMKVVQMSGWRIFLGTRLYGKYSLKYRPGYRENILKSACFDI